MAKHARTADPAIAARYGTDGTVGAVYFLQLTSPADGSPIVMGNPSNPRAQASTYIGWTYRDPFERLAEHNSGDGAAITRAGVRVYGGQWQLVYVVPDAPRCLERQLKTRVKCARKAIAQLSRHGIGNYVS